MKKNTIYSLAVKVLQFSRLSLFSLFFLCSAALVAQSGSIKGTIVDSKTNEPLIGASVLVEGTSLGAAADLDGNFEIKSVPAGTHTLRASYVAYRPLTIQKVLVEKGKETILNFAMQTDDVSLDEVVVVATARKESERILLMDQKGATVIRESVGAKQLSMQGVSDVATATSKITGVVKSEGSGEVFVRGLGDRYLSTTMNGLPIPSDDVNKKNINLGLFDTGVIQNVGIGKTYNPEGYIDQTAGNVNIISKEFIEQFSVSLRAGANTNIFANDMFSNFMISPNMDNVAFSFYNRDNSLLDGITKQQWDPKKHAFPLDWGISTIGGFKINPSKPLSVFYTLSYKEDFSYYTGVYRKYAENILQAEFDDTESWTSNQNLTGLLNLAYRFNNNHKLNFNTLFINKLSDNVYEQGRNGKGYIRDSGDLIEDHVFDRDQNTKTTQILVNQLIGVHDLLKTNKLEWAVGFNTVSADEPNRIRNRVGRYNEKIFFNVHGIGPYDNRKSNQEINDQEINGYIKDKHEFKLNDKDFNVNFGFNYRNKTRDFKSKFIGSDLTEMEIPTDDLNDITAIYTSSEFTEELIAKNLPEELYDASLNVYAGFLDLGFSFGKLSGDVGVRYETDKIDLSWEINNDGKDDVTKRDTIYNGIYPNLNLKYDISDAHILRLSASKTITLPEFKEIAPFPYVSPTGNITKGNPELKKSENYNLDLKWEYYKSPDELISFASFYKRIKDPINVTMERGAARSFITQNTGSYADVFGLEAEARLNLYKTENQVFRMILNATKMWFKQELLEQYYYNNKTTSGLQGAPEFIANAALSYENKKSAWQASLSANYSSDKIFALGHPLSAVQTDVYYNDDIIEKGFLTLDAVLSKDITEKLSIKLIGRNLLNPKIEQTQKVKDYSGNETNNVVESLKKGIKLQLSVNYKF